MLRRQLWAMNSCSNRSANSRYLRSWSERLASPMTAGEVRRHLKVGRRGRQLHPDLIVEGFLELLGHAHLVLPVGSNVSILSPGGLTAPRGLTWPSPIRVSVHGR